MALGRRLALGGAALLLCALLGGCGGKELHQRILIQGMGVDRAAAGYQVTVCAALSPEEEELFTCQGATVLEALGSLALSTGREPFYAHNYLVVFGESCGEEGLGETLDFFLRYYNARPAVKMYLAQGPAGEVLRQAAEGGLSMEELQALGAVGESEGLGASVDFLEFVNSGRRPGSSPVLPVLRAGEGEVSLLGTAYFREHVLQGVLSQEGTRGYLAASGKLSGGQLVVEDKALGVVTLTLSKGGGKRTAALSQQGEPSFLVKAWAAADVSSVSGAGPLEEDFYRRLEEAASQKLQEEMEAMWEQAARRRRCDILGLGNLLSQRFPQAWEGLAGSWEEELPRCPVRFEARVTVARLGKNTTPAGR